MIVHAKVIKSFKHKNTGLVWFEGDMFKGSDDAAAQLAAKGLLDYDGHAPKEPERPEQPELAALTVKELVAICVERKIETPSRPRKADLIAAIRTAS